MTYASFKKRLSDGCVILLDGGTGTELERRGVPMNADAWCGPAALGHRDILEAVHRDYIAAGAEIITVNSFATSPLMLGAAGLAEQFVDINRASVEAALRAREAYRAGNGGRLAQRIPAGFCLRRRCVHSWDAARILIELRIEVTPRSSRRRSSGDRSRSR